MIGKIERIPLRDVWEHEAYDFNKWLQDNIDVLSNVTNINLSNPEREQNAGDFSVDIVAEDGNGNPVIIENQLEKSDHKHLGQIITYLVSIGAKTAIWIVSKPRTEHINAINWLNESSSANFYLIKVEAIKIGDSPSAPLLTVIVGPSEASKEVGQTKKELAERYLIREKFWTQLLELSRNKTKLHSNISTTQHNWIGTSAGVRGLGFNYAIRKDNAQVELYIDRGDGCEESNKDVFSQLFQRKKEIEDTFGGSLEWQSLEGKRACRIRKQIDTGGYRNENWAEIHEEMVKNMINLEKALKIHIKNLKIKVINDE
jgi:hypothetical protein